MAKLTGVLKLADIEGILKEFFPQSYKKQDLEPNSIDSDET